jgi:hypothetical protein
MIALKLLCAFLAGALCALRYREPILQKLGEVVTEFIFQMDFPSQTKREKEE